MTSKTQLQGIKEAVDAAAIALPVLFTMCSTAGLKPGAMAADEILGSVKWAQKELAHMMTADETITGVEALRAENANLRDNITRILTQRSAVETTASHIPIGWRLVPETLTSDMQHAQYHAGGRSTSNSFFEMQWAAVLAAAPTLTKAPFPYPCDRIGWICSVCHQWNHPKDKFCSHESRPATDSPEEPDGCPNCGNPELLTSPWGGCRKCGWNGLTGAPEKADEPCGYLTDKGEGDRRALTSFPENGIAPP
jgi:hypothetical protein